MEKNALEDQGGSGGKAGRLFVPLPDFLKGQTWVSTIIFLGLREDF